jgi:uncharacterized iron-regulated membrane protein
MSRLKRSLLRKKRKSESWFKYIMSVLHLWLGLLSSMVVFFACITGSIYAFKQQIEDVIHSEYVWINQIDQQQIKPELALSNFEDKYGSATGLKIFGQGNKSIEITSFSRNNSGVTAYYHPITGDFIGTKSTATRAFFAFILDFHRFLLAGDVGKVINGIAILIFVFMLLSGFIIWLPKKIKQLKDHLLIRFKARFYRINYDLHRVLGFYSLVLLMFIALTGLYVSFHWMKNLMIMSLGGESIVISETNMALKEELSESFKSVLNNLNKEKQKSDDTEWNLNEIIHNSDSIFPLEGVLSIQLPNDQIRSINVDHLNNDNALKFYVPDRIEFTLSGKVRGVERFNELPLHEQFKTIAKPLHTGEIMGLPSIIIYFIVSLIGSSLPITGFIIWWKKAT